MKIKKSLLFSLIIGLAVLGSCALNAGITLWLIKHNQPATIVGVDVDKITKSIVLSLAKTNLEQDALRQQSSKSLEALEQILHSASRKNKVIILPSKAIISGAPDITSQVEHLLKLKQERK